MKWLYLKGKPQNPEETREELITKPRCLPGQLAQTAVNQPDLTIFVKNAGTTTGRK